MRGYRSSPMELRTTEGRHLRHRDRQTSRDHGTITCCRMRHNAIVCKHRPLRQRRSTREPEALPVENIKPRSTTFILPDGRRLILLAGGAGVNLARQPAAVRGAWRSPPRAATAARTRAAPSCRRAAPRRAPGARAPACGVPDGRRLVLAAHHSGSDRIWTGLVHADVRRALSSRTPESCTSSFSACSPRTFSSRSWAKHRTPR